MSRSTSSPGPFEAGVFYYRMPDEPKGRILSITDKHFPFLVGDGASTVEDLIWAEPRLRKHVRRILAEAEALPEEEQDRRFIRVAKRFLGVYQGESATRGIACSRTRPVRSRSAASSARSAPPPSSRRRCA